MLMAEENPEMRWTNSRVGGVLPVVSGPSRSRVYPNWSRLGLQNTHMPLSGNDSVFLSRRLQSLIR